MLNESEVDFAIECLPEDATIRGNCMASGDDGVDEQCAREIESDLESGNTWAWCTVKVTASWNGVEESDYLGCCSYKSEADFKGCGYFEDMKAQALQCLRDAIPEPGDEVIVREEVNHKVASVDMDEKTVTLVEDGRTVPWSDIEHYKSL